MLLLTSVAILLLLGSVTGFVWHERMLALGQAADLAERRTARLGEDLQQTLALAKVAIEQTETALAKGQGTDQAEATRALTRQRGELLAALPMPFSLRVLDAEGRVLDDALSGLPAVAAAAGLSLQRPAPGGPPGRWQVGHTQGPIGARVVPLVRASVKLPAGMAGFAVDLSHEALQRRFEADRQAGGGGVAMFRLEPDGTASLLARAPLIESELGMTVRGPLVQALMRAPSGTFDAVTQIDGLRRVVAYRRLTDDANQLVLAYGMSSDVVLASWQARLPYIAAVSLLLALGMGLGGWRLSRSLREMNRSHLALAQSEQHFRALADNLPDVVTQVDREGRLVYANEAIERTMGLQPTAMIGQTLALLGQPGAQQASWIDCLNRLFISGRAQRLAFSRSGPDGALSHWESLLVLEPSGDGGEPLALMISRDISARRAADDALRASEALMRHFFDSGLVGMAITTVGEAGGQFNARLREMLGYSDEQLQQLTWPEITHRDDLCADLAQFNRLLAGEIEAYRLDKRVIRGDGTVLEAAIAVHCQRDGSGQPLRFFAIIEDIGERKQVEAQLEHRVQQRTAELARSESRWRSIFETVPVAIGEEDWSGVQALLRGLRDGGVQDGPAYFDGHPDFVEQCLRAVRVQRLNQKALQLHDAGGPAQDLNLAELRSIAPGRKALPQFIGKLQALWTGQRHYAGDKSLPSSSGQPQRLLVTMSLPALDDTDGTALVCLVDISEIDRLNRELDRSVSRLRQVNQELETFTYSVSHDLKAPLRGIDGYSRLLLSEHQEQLGDEARQFLQRIRQATQQMGVLIDDLLTYSRLERREQTLIALPLAAIVRHVLQACEQELQARGMQVQVVVAAELRALGDAQGLTMSLRNLVDNALKFSRDSAEPRIDISASLSDGLVRLSICDNGPGFDMRFHDRIFAIFQRLHRAEDFPGTGVGLAIVRKAMERMGGRVWADSQPGQGASFTLELPQAPAVANSPAAAEDAPHTPETAP